MHVIGSGDLSWYDFISALYASPEFKQKTCETSYYTYGEKIKDSALTLRDLFNGRARLPQISESEKLGLDFIGGSVDAIWDQKLPTVKSKDSYLGFTRGHRLVGENKHQFNIFVLESKDSGLTFKNISGPGIFRPAPDDQYYDPHVSIDHSTCPPRYVMAMECALSGKVGTPSLCTSFTSTPSLPETWSQPTLVVQGCSNTGGNHCETSSRFISASTGVTLADGKQKFLKWTELDDGPTNFQDADGKLNTDEGDERALSKGVAVADFSKYVNSTLNIASMVLKAENNVRCTSAWDCNNRDMHDWKKEGDQYYAVYNGANYYRCVRPNSEGLVRTPDGNGFVNGQGNSKWAISVSRSPMAIGGVQEALSYDQTLKAVRTDTCGISYPMINAVNGELFVYFAYQDLEGVPRIVRAPLKPQISK